MDFLETISVMPGDLGNFRGCLDMRTGLGFELVSDSLELQNDKHIYLYKSIYVICCFYYI